MKDKELEEHIFTPVPGATYCKCSCGKAFATAVEQTQHHNWHFNVYTNNLIAQERRKAKIEELENFRAFVSYNPEDNFTLDQLNYRIAELKEDKGGNKGE